MEEETSAHGDQEGLLEERLALYCLRRRIAWSTGVLEMEANNPGQWKSPVDRGRSTIQ
jgi:hypothetical protein